jgi:hypothetical protein
VVVSGRIGRVATNVSRCLISDGNPLRAVVALVDRRSAASDATGNQFQDDHDGEFQLLPGRYGVPHVYQAEGAVHDPDVATGVGREGAAFGDRTLFRKKVSGSYTYLGWIEIEIRKN